MNVYLGICTREPRFLAFFAGDDVDIETCVSISGEPKNREVTNFGVSLFERLERFAGGVGVSGTVGDKKAWDKRNTSLIKISHILLARKQTIRGRYFKILLMKSGTAARISAGDNSDC